MNKPLLQERSSPAAIEQVIDQLHQWLGSRISTSESVCEQHGKGESWHPVCAPDAVCFAQSTEEVARIVTTCAEHRVPIIAFGSGTSLEGHLQALAGGICIDLSQMNQVLSIHAADLDCRVQAGVTRKQLNQELRDTGLFFPVDPGADASIGGMAATRASGTNAVRYGTMRENVLSLTYVDAAGNIVQTGSRAKKSSAGFDLTHLLVGSEGTLGVITEIGLRLHGQPEVVQSAVVNFQSVQDAVNTVIDVIQMGLPMARIELIDTAYMQAINAYSQTDYPERDTLFLEFHGTQISVDEQVATFKQISADYGSGEFLVAQKEEDRSRLWRARHNAYYAIMAANPGTNAMTTDVCVPISKLAEIIGYIRGQMTDSSFKAELIGHVGDGNFHMVFCVAHDDQEALSEALRLNDLLVTRAIELGGTCTGEHGVGSGKLKYLRREHGNEAVDTMRAIKLALDPHNLMNPGKTIDI